MDLNFLTDVLKSFTDDTLRLAATLCVVFAVLPYAMFKGEKSARIKFAAFVLVAVFFGIVITQFNSKTKVESQSSVRAAANEIEIPAVTYKRGQNVARGPLPNLYGSDVLMNAPPFHDAPNAAEFDIYIPAGGNYKLSVRLAAAEPRPVDVFVNGTLAIPGALNISTGGWLPVNQKWEDAGTLTLREGINTIKLQRSSVFPHIMTLKLSPP